MKIFGGINTAGKYNPREAMLPNTQSKGGENTGGVPKHEFSQDLNRRVQETRSTQKEFGGKKPVKGKDNPDVAG